MHSFDTSAIDSATIRQLTETQAAWLAARNDYVSKKRQMEAELAALRTVRDNADRTYRDLERQTYSRFGASFGMRLLQVTFKRAQRSLERSQDIAPERATMPYSELSAHA